MRENRKDEERGERKKTRGPPSSSFWLLQVEVEAEFFFPETQAIQLFDETFLSPSIPRGRLPSLPVSLFPFFSFDSGTACSMLLPAVPVGTGIGVRERAISKLAR
jgi:hypothetical protein